MLIHAAMLNANPSVKYAEFMLSCHTIHAIKISGEFSANMRKSAEHRVKTKKSRELMRGNDVRPT